MYKLQVVILATLIQGCTWGEDAGKEAVTSAQRQMKDGDLPAAAMAFEAAAKENPESVDAAAGAALAALLRGDTVAADAYLQAVEPTAGERIAEVRLRRALVAQKAKMWDQVRQFGIASGHPAGLLLAGEVALAEGERDEAQNLFEQVAGGAFEASASAYLDLLGDPDPIVAGLSEAQALWALGDRKIAAKSVPDLLPRYPERRGDRDSQLLLWASRAASVRQAEVARGLLKAMKRAPEGQEWRKDATDAIISCVEGNAKRCIRNLDRLEDTAPADGLADARATAAYLIADVDPNAAKQLVGEYRSDAAASALWAAGAIRAAQRTAPDGPFKDFIEAGG